MLNCCIDKKNARGIQEKEKPEDADLSAEGESDEDEFFDCEEILNIADVRKVNKPLGRLKKCGRLRILQSGEPMYIPVTQDPAPLTEDVVDEQSKILVDLGNDAEGSELRAKMMSASLSSDMQSFKAANPGASLEDFVRWYSPRDWIESEELDEYGSAIGELSPRMKVPGNLWQEVWSHTQPVPSRRQKRLFDDTKEAEKVLQWMTSRTLKDISELLFPCLLHIALLKILDESDQLSVNYNIPVTVTQQISQLTRSGLVPSADDDRSVTPDGGSIQIGNVMSSFARAESDMSQLHSFSQKFPQIPLNEVIGSEEVTSTAPYRLISKFLRIDGGLKSPVGTRIKDIFCKELAISQLVESEKEFKFGSASRRVFVLKYLPKKSSCTSDLSVPQRMSCCLKSDEFLVAGTFSTKTDFC